MKHKLLFIVLSFLLGSCCCLNKKNCSPCYSKTDSISDPGEKNSRIFSRRGYGLKEGEPKLESRALEYAEPDRKTLYGYGTPISIEVARLLIKNYWDYLKEQYEKQGETKNEILGEQRVAFTIGKEALLSVLQQEKCLGIRFYLAKKNPENCPDKGDWNNGITLVPIGVSLENKVEKEIGAINDYIVSDLEKRSLYSDKSQENVPIPECLPTKKLSDYSQMGLIGTEFDEIVRDYLRAKRTKK